MSDPTDSTPRSIALRSNRSLSVGGNSLISRGLQDLAKHTAEPPSMPSVQTDDICEAIKGGDVEAVRRILDADPTRVEAVCDGEWPLDLAAQKGHISIVELLLSHGAEIEPEDIEGSLQYAVEELACGTDHYYVRGDLISEFYSFEDTPLRLAVEGGHAGVVELLLSRGACIETPDAYYNRPLHQAVKNGHADIVELLLSQGADVNSANEDGWTPLHYAAIHGHVAVAEMLLSRGAAVDAEESRPVLHRIDEADDHIVVKDEELDESCEIPFDEYFRSYAPEQCCTPLHWAAFFCRTDMVKLLLSRGANVNATTIGGQTPLDLARNEAMAEAIRQYGGVSGKAVR